MIKRHSDEEIQRLAADYHTHGAVHLPGFLADAALATLQRVVDTATTALMHPAAAGQTASVLRSEGRLTLRYLWRDSAELRDVLLQRDLAEPIARIIGSETLRFWFDLTFVHHGTGSREIVGAGAGAGRGIGTPWHHDVPMFSFKGELMPSLWLALTPTHAELCRLMFIDGSHRTNQGYYRSPEIAKPADGSSDGFVDLPNFDALIDAGDVRMLTWDCAPGDAILLHPATIHGARGHDGSGSHACRIAMTTRWLGDDARFLPHSYERALQQPAVVDAGLKIGQRPYGDWFPLVYDAAEAASESSSRAASDPNQGA